MMRNEIFRYGDVDTTKLKARDCRLAEVVEKVGHIRRARIPDLFSAPVNSIVGRQISAKAYATIRNRMPDEPGFPITPECIEGIDAGALPKFGITFRKAEYITKAARKVTAGEPDIGK